MIPNLHILGIQGSGKGTQSALLVKKYNFSYISSGNLFRLRSQVNDTLGHTIAEQLKQGHLMSDHLLFDVVEQYLNKEQIACGFLGDGVIRTASQYKGLQSIWQNHNLDTPLLIHLELTEEIALERIAHRTEDLADLSKLDYHKTYSGKLAHRTDDNPSAIQERFSLFHTMTTPVIERFKETNRCIDISANQSIEAIHQEICHNMARYYPEFSHGPNKNS